MTAKAYASLGYFSGLNTVEDPVRLKVDTIKTPDGYKSAYPLVEAMNVEVDNSYALSSRAGLTDLMDGANMHSYWANEKGTLCFFMDETVLYALNFDYSVTAIVTLSSADRVSFAEFNSRVYYSNGRDIGYIENYISSGIPLQVKEYKKPLPAGKYLGVFRGRLYVAVDNILYIGDALSDCYDSRYGYRFFIEDITMVLPVDEGIYISDNRTWFLSNKSLVEGDKLDLHRQVTNAGRAVPYTGIRVNGDLISETGVNGKVGMWLSEDGICVGDNQGNVQNVTEKRYVLSDYAEGSSVLRDIEGTIHYITVLRK